MWRTDEHGPGRIARHRRPTRAVAPARRAPPPWTRRPRARPRRTWLGRAALARRTAALGGRPVRPPGRAGPRARRGDVRSAILDVLSVEPMNGYQVIQQIAERTGGVEAQPGSVYPTVQQLEDEGLVEGSEDGGRRLLRLTDDGRDVRRGAPRRARRHLAALHRGRRPATTGAPDLKPVIGQVMSAVWQVMTHRHPQQQAEAAEILADTRRRLYGLLADGDPES